MANMAQISLDRLGVRLAGRDRDGRSRDPLHHSLKLRGRRAEPAPLPVTQLRPLAVNINAGPGHMFGGLGRRNPLAWPSSR